MNTILIAAALVVSPIAEGEYADTESVTNIPLKVNVERIERVRIKLDFEAAENANLEIALGTDSDNDGNLSTAEVDLRAGYDCGKWKFWSVQTDAETFEPLADGGIRSREITIPQKRFNPRWNLLKVVRRGAATLSESVTLNIDGIMFSVIIR